MEHSAVFEKAVAGIERYKWDKRPVVVAVLGQEFSGCLINLLCETSTIKTAILF
jgi:hypothetical protein